ncbi:Lrp/AsnC ligand binding domain-containing protein [Novosphingobium resinovorum]
MTWLADIPEVAECYGMSGEPDYAASRSVPSG